jgi:pSer/pThr/pTyr-binding forkhead associated (FHA) protein
MDVILKVIEGAKHGAKVAIKKPEFLIGRSQECHLCAGSSAISRRHCIIRRYDDEQRISIQDLGSRNGTLVNGVKADGEVTLRSGDELVIGPLKFLLTISSGIKNAKQPEVKSVAEAVQRTAAAASQSDTLREDDISSWLLGDPGPAAFSETQTMRMDDTNALHFHAAAQQGGADLSGEAPAVPAVNEEGKESPPDAKGADAKGADEKGPDDDKSKPTGKLPFRSAPAAKDSREAATQALKNWSRRR